jgi:hypothetical protein
MGRIPQPGHPIRTRFGDHLMFEFDHRGSRYRVTLTDAVFTVDRLVDDAWCADATLPVATAEALAAVAPVLTVADPTATYVKLCEQL